jgi:DNA repair exonuclease SbcCD ATPase subunit
MSDNEFSEKIIKQLTALLKPPILISNLKNSGKFIFIAGVFCTGNLCLNYFLNRNLEKIIFQNYENKKIDKINNRISKIKRRIKRIQSYNENKNELFLSLLQIHDSLFSEVRYAVNQIELIHNRLHEITDKLKSIQHASVPMIENGSSMVDKDSYIEDNYFVHLVEDQRSNIEDQSNENDSENENDNKDMYTHIEVNDETISSSNLDSPFSNSSDSYGNYDILSF